MSLSKWVLTKEQTTYGGELYYSVLTIYDTHDQVLKRIKKIEKANKQYKMREVMKDIWVIGPEEDEGFFGHRPITFRAKEVVYDPA